MDRLDYDLDQMAKDYETKRPRRIAFWTVMSVIVTILIIAIFMGIIVIVPKTNYGFVDLNGESGIADHCETNRGQLYCTTYRNHHTWQVREYWREERVDE